MISVIVPIYKVETYLRQSLDSILNQSYRDLDIILIDDGSPDRCGEICDEYEKQDKRVRVFHTSNRGLSSARNLGLREAKGNHIGFVDSDDWIEPNMFEVLLRRLEDTKSDICICDYNQGPGVFEKEFQPAEEVYEGIEALKALLNQEINYNVWNKLFCRELFQDIHFPEGRNYEDIGIMHRIMYKAKRVAVIPDVGYHYRVRAESITKTYTAQNLIDHADAYLSSYSFLIDCQKELIPVQHQELLRLPAKGISQVWRWWHGCSSDEKQKYLERIKEFQCFTREHFPLFGYNSWPGYLRLTTAFMRSRSVVSFATLYGLNQVFRKFWPEKSNAIEG